MPVRESTPFRLRNHGEPLSRAVPSIRSDRRLGPGSGRCGNGPHPERSADGQRPSPLAPGPAPLDRLIAYGRARIDFLAWHREIARAALDGNQPVPAGSQTPTSGVHISYLPQEMRLGAAKLDVLAFQLTAALDAPLLLYLSDLEDAPKVTERLGRGREDLVQRVCRS
jgi:hypothetical protein